MGKKMNLWLLIPFLLLQLVAYYMILWEGGDLRRWSSYGAILLCFAFAAIHFKKGEKWILAGLLFTVGADFCLVAMQPQQQFWGMVFFLGTQSCYAIHL